jgi:hypothetical protein
MSKYPKEELDPDYEDDGQIVDNVQELEEAVVGHKIVSAEWVEGVFAHGWRLTHQSKAFVLTLDNGTKVRLHDTDDCCAYTALESFLLHPERVDHVILGVGTTDRYQKWHIYADMGDVLELQVGWSCGNPFYYGYGFDITVEPVGP